MSKEDKAELIKIIGWSASSILFAGLIFFWTYRVRVANINRKEALKRQIKELEIKAIRSQMNPHFMFNALNSIQSLINNQQYKEANIYLEKFSLLMRRVLNNSGKTFVRRSESGRDGYEYRYADGRCFNAFCFVEGVDGHHARIPRMCRFGTIRLGLMAPATRLCQR